MAGWVSGLVLAAAVLWHGWRTLRLFPSARAVLDRRPVISVDHAIHLYHGYLGARFLRRHGTSWGYDPFFMAGYPKTPIYDSSSGPAELFCLIGGGYSPRAYKLGVALLVLLGPLLVFPAGRRCGAGFCSAAAAACWAVWYWWVGFPEVLVKSGLVAFVWASGLAVLLPSLLAGFGRRGTGLATSAGPNGLLTGSGIGRQSLTWAGLAVVAALGMQAHPTFPLMVLPAAAAAYLTLTAGRAHRWPWHLSAWLAAATAAALTVPWWWPLLRFLPIKTPSTTFLKADYAGFVVDYYLGWGEARIPLLAVLFGMVGLARWRRAGRTEALAAFVTQIIWLSALTFAGSLWAVSRNLEPARFQVPLVLTWCVPAGEGMVAVIGWSTTWARPGRAAAPARLAGAVAVWLAAACISSPLAGLLGVGPVFSSWRATARRLAQARPLAVGLRPEMKGLIDWIKNHTDNSARILLEDQLRLWEATEAESLHWTPLLPVLTGRQFVGGLYQCAFIKHHRVSFGDWHLVGRPIWAWRPVQLKQFCQQYNIGWVITWSRANRGQAGGRPLSTDVFGSLPFCRKVATVARATSRPFENRYTIFRVLGRPGYFLEGTGRVAAVDYNRIELAELVPRHGRLVLCYHWQDGLAAHADDRPVRLFPVAVAGDPVGFIGIETARPLRRLCIRNSYR